jgi:hypothetical protein
MRRLGLILVLGGCGSVGANKFPDAAPPDAPIVPDAASPDADTTPDAFVDPSLGIPGTPCSDATAISCATHAGPQQTDCVAGQWAIYSSCSGSQLCDTEPGVKHGTCQDPLAECAGQTPGYAICTGATREVCGPDLITSTTETCVSDLACLASTGPSCAACGQPSDCPGTPPTCKVASCTGGTCGLDNVTDDTLVSNADPNDCARTVCKSGAPTVVFDGTENCGANTTCVAIGQCSGQLGATCDPATTGFCDSGKCVDSVCCDSDCNGTCQTCAGTGTCHAVVSGPDDSCTGGQSCGATSTCQSPLGATCSAGPDCLSGICAVTYVDSDDDGYGLNGSASTGMRCVGADHHGAGYSDRLGDRCDIDANANPGRVYDVSSFGYTVADACGDFDYNADGVTELYPLACPPTPPTSGGSVYVYCYYAAVATNCGVDTQPTDQYFCSPSGCAYNSSGGNQVVTCY